MSDEQDRGRHDDNVEKCEVKLVIEVGPTLAHLFKRLFPKSQQAEVDALTENLSKGADSLKAAVEANTPKAE